MSHLITHSAATASYPVRPGDKRWKSALTEEQAQLLCVTTVREGSQAWEATTGALTLRMSPLLKLSSSSAVALKSYLAMASILSVTHDLPVHFPLHSFLLPTLHSRSSPFTICYFHLPLPVFIYLCSFAARGHLPSGLPWHPANRTCRYYRPCTTKQETRSQRTSPKITML